MKKFTFASVYLFLIVLLAVSPGLAASFSADMVIEKDGKTQTGRFYRSDHFYRMDLVEDNKSLAIIADTGKNKHSIVNMADKAYFEMPSDDFGVLSNDPFKASDYIVSKYGSKAEGTEKIDGIVCEKQDVVVQDNKIHSRWFSRELDFPLKLITYHGKKAAYVVELTNVKKTVLRADLFAPPADFKKIEAPGAAAKRKREQARKNEEALAGLTTKSSAAVPCYVKIAAGGELRVPIDATRRAILDIVNQSEGQSVFRVDRYRNGKPLRGGDPDARTLEGIGRHKSVDFNDAFAQRTKSSLVDELGIRVEKGLVYAEVSQKGDDRSDVYNRGGWQTDINADPERPLTLSVTGDNPFGKETTGRYWLRYRSGGSSEAIPFTVETGKTRTWNYAAEKGIKIVALSIGRGDGRARISLMQPPRPQKPMAPKTKVKKKSRRSYTPKAKPVTEFTVTYPAGTGRPISPEKDLDITVTGLSGDVSGTIELYSDRKKTRKIDSIKFKLQKGQAETFAVSADKKVGWATVWVYKGSFKVKLDQSSGQ